MRRAQLPIIEPISRDQEHMPPSGETDHERPPVAGHATAGAGQRPADAAGPGNAAPQDGTVSVLIQALAASPFAVAISDPAGRIEFANACFLDLFGQTEEEIIGIPVSLLRASAHDGPQLMWKALEQGDSWRDEFHGRSKDGKEFWAAIAVSPLFDRQGKVSHLIGIALDITHYKQDPQHAPPSPPDMVLVSDVGGTILFIDRTVAGVTREEAIGASVFDYVPAEHHDRLRAYMGEVVRTKGSLTYEIPSVGPHRTTSQYVVQVGPIEREGAVVALSFIASAVAGLPDASLDAPAGTGEPGDVAEPRHLPELSGRELEVLELLARGYTNREVAQHLKLSIRTIDHHVGHILDKLQASNRTAAVATARQVGILSTWRGPA